MSVALPGRRIQGGSSRKGRGSRTPLCRPTSACITEMKCVPETESRTNVEEKEGVPLYIQTLNRIFGHKNAEAFLHPLSKEDMIVPKAQEIYKKAKGLRSEEVWKLLRDESESKLMAMDSSNPPPSVVRLCNETLTRKRLQEVQKRADRRKSCLALMYQTAQANLRQTARLLARNPLPDYSCLLSGDSPRKYFTRDTLVKLAVSPALCEIL
ncbi:uncharacterized protein LOC118772166 [Megalops cyprinoides]|uniref:uncharacterized protein LOC118772166 n=1 Tax=Megalops cyprinoides TaxID=118141 RepID=UPI001863D0CB|nr:uncharacterized protein LOC118772166 [Megalops cyprinoides]